MMEEMMANFMKQPTFWREVRRGSMVVLSDIQALMEASKKGYPVKDGVNYEVKFIRRVKEISGMCEWIFFGLACMYDPTDEAILVAKIVDQAVDIRCYFEMPEFQPGNRADMIAREWYWLFEDPGKENWGYNDLKFTIVVNLNPDSPKMVTYRQKVGEFFGKVKDDPRQSGMGDLIAAVVEYGTTQETDNPDLMILEVGNADSNEGGLIKMLLGCPLNATDIQVIKR